MWMLTQIVALDTAAKTYYTPWFPRQAMNAVFTMEKTSDSIGGTAFQIDVFNKNREDEGSAPGSSVGTINTALVANFYQLNATALKELVRFKITFTASAAGQGVIFRLLPPTWYDEAV